MGLLLMSEALGELPAVALTAMFELDDFDERDASVASDVYSTGITLYQLVAGTTPFAGPDLASTVRRILTSPPPRIDRPGMPPGLNRVLQDVLAKFRVGGLYVPPLSV